MSEASYSFGAWLRRNRKEKDLTQQTLADRAYCSLTMIKKIETDQRRPSRQLAKSLAHKLAIQQALAAGEVLHFPAAQLFQERARRVLPVRAPSLGERT